MVASAFLPVALHKNQLFFLFGKEAANDSAPGFSDFGGGVKPNEDIYLAGLREMAEETTGFFGGPNDIGKMIQRNGGYYPLVEGSYHIHIFPMGYEPNVVDYFNRSHKFVYDHIDHRVLKKSMIFEKVEIQWMTIPEMKRRRREFRPFYRAILDRIIQESPQIKQFITKQTRK